MATQNQIWTTEEEAALLAGVERHGSGNWEVILSDIQFASSLANRTNNNLKSKWRTLGKRFDVSKSKVVDVLMHPQRQKSRKWTNDEEEALFAGVEKHGYGKWKIILSDPQFASSLANRSNIDIKGKWRYLEMRSDVSNNRKKVRTYRYIHPHSTKKVTKKRGKKTVVEELSDSEGDSVEEVSDSRGYSVEEVSDSQGDSAEEVGDSKYYPVEEVSDSQGYSVEEVGDSQVHPVDGVSDSKDYFVEEVSNSQVYHHPCTITRQRRGTCSNMVNQARKLNSEQVHTYLENLWASFPEDKKSSFTRLDPLWYDLYSNDSNKKKLHDSNKKKVLNWIRKKEIFSKKYVILPIAQWGHWSLVIFCHFGESLGSKVKTPCILLLDSLEKADHSKQHEPLIRKFVLDIYRNLERTEDEKLLRKMPFLVPNVPQQRDNEECGFFVLYYIKLFVENAPESFSTSDGYPYFMKKDWFDSEGLDSFCKTLEAIDI